MEPVLCLVTDRRRHGGNWRESILAQVRAAATAGVHLVQVREPGLEAGVLCGLVEACLDATRGTPTRVVVNDRLDVARAAGAHGVHLRGDSIPSSRVREWFPRPGLVGQSLRSPEDGDLLAADEVDYAVFGTVYETPAKPGVVPAGLARLSTVASTSRVPVLAIGGVTPARVPELIRAGAAGIAGIGLFLDDPGSVVEEIRRAMSSSSSGSTRGGVR